jgi:hypothetical protein
MILQNFLAQSLVTRVANRDDTKMLTYMLRHCWIALVFLIASFTGWAQTKITVGKPYEVIDSPSKYYFSQNGQIMTLKVDKKDIIIQKMDARSLTLKSIKVYDDFPGNYVIEKVTEFKNHYYLFYSTYEDDKEMLSSAARLILRKGSLPGKVKMF